MMVLVHRASCPCYPMESFLSMFLQIKHARAALGVVIDNEGSQEYGPIKGFDVVQILSPVGLDDHLC